MVIWLSLRLVNVVTGWCKGESEVRQGSRLSPLLFNLYTREPGMRIEECQECLKYSSVSSNGELKRSKLAALMYADDVAYLRRVGRLCRGSVIM